MENNFQTAYNEALELAKARLLGCDPDRVCANSGARIVSRAPHPAIELAYMNSAIVIEFSAGDWFEKNSGEIHIWDKLLLLHYILHASQDQPSSRKIAFKELKSASMYNQVFEGRCVRPLVKAFVECPDRLLEAFDVLGARQISSGDAAAEIQVLPKITLTCILWKADEEFPASANLLFAENIESFLPAEDIVVMSQRVVLKLLGKW
jgi:hypothetical protein